MILPNKLRHVNTWRVSSENRGTPPRAASAPSLGKGTECAKWEQVKTKNGFVCPSTHPQAFLLTSDIIALLLGLSYLLLFFWRQVRSQEYIALVTTQGLRKISTKFEEVQDNCTLCQKLSWEKGSVPSEKWSLLTFPIQKNRPKSFNIAEILVVCFLAQNHFSLWC